jgi:hypothetical protein
LEKWPKITQKVSKRDKKGDFSSKMANSKYDSLIQSTIKSNSKDYSISNFFRNIQFKKLLNNLFSRKIQFKN